MRLLFIFFLLCGCSLNRIGDKKTKEQYPQQATHSSSFQKADTNKDLVIDQNESIAYFSGLKTEEIYSPAYSFLFIIGLVFVFVSFCIFISREKN
tara:strand:- start:1259 stop:1543 length:285 start_codon:yes stop_codon:yes gene_type:complete